MNSTNRGIGSDVSIFHQVTIGEWRSGAPLIGNNCSIFGGAKVIGGLFIGDNSIVGANVVVWESVPKNSTVSMAAPTITTRTLKKQ